MTEELKQEYLKKMSYEEWEAKIFEGIKNRFYIHDIWETDDGYRLYFVRDFKVFISKLHFEYWYNRYLYRVDITDHFLIDIEETVNELDYIITNEWMRQIKKEEKK